VLDVAMKRIFILAVLTALTACAATNSGDAGGSWLGGTALSCHSDAARACRGAGCDIAAAQDRWEAPISLTVPALNTTGRFCLATGCEPAQIVPTQTRALGHTARVYTDDRTEMRADLEIARDLSTFRLRWASEDGVNEWTGACQPAGS